MRGAGTQIRGGAAPTSAHGGDGCGGAGGNRPDAQGAAAPWMGGGVGTQEMKEAGGERAAQGGGARWCWGAQIERVAAGVGASAALREGEGDRARGSLG